MKRTAMLAKLMIWICVVVNHPYVWFINCRNSYGPAGGVISKCSVGVGSTHGAQYCGMVKSETRNASLLGAFLEPIFAMVRSPSVAYNHRCNLSLRPSA
jgi:hypothetical protein